MEVRALFGRFVWRGVSIDDVTIHLSRGSKINPTLKVCEHNRVVHASMAANKDTSLRSWDGWRASHGKSNKKKRSDEKTKAQRTEAQSSMTRTSSDLAGLLISIGKIVQREESGQSKDFEEGKWCSHASATATCEQSWPKQEGKD